MSGPWEDFKSKSAKKEKGPWEDFSIEESQDVLSRPTDIGAGTQLLSDVGNVLDIIESPIRAGAIEATKSPLLLAAQPGKTMERAGRATVEQIKKNFQSPLSAPSQVPPFSQAYEQLGVPSPASDIAGLATSVAIPGPLEAIALSKPGRKTLQEGIRGMKSAVRSVEEAQLAKVLDKFSTKGQAVGQNMNADEISKRLVDLDLGRYATDADKMLEVIGGGVEEVPNQIAPGMTSFSQKVKKPGLIETIAKDLKERVGQVSTDENLKIKVPYLASKQKLKSTMSIVDPLSGIPFDPNEIAKRQQLVDQILKPYDTVRVPGIPFEELTKYADNAVGSVPPPVPMGPPDMFPIQTQESLVKMPNIPPKPEFEGIEIPQLLKAPEDQNRMTVPNFEEFVTRSYPPKPQEPAKYAGIVSDRAMEKYLEDLKNWEDQVAALDKQYDSEQLRLLSSKEDALKAAEKTRSAMASDAINKFDQLKSDWEKEVNLIKQEYQSQLNSARGYDQKVMEAKIAHAAERFKERASRNEKYKKEVIDNNARFLEIVQDGLKEQIFKEPNYLTLDEMMELRSGINRQIDAGKIYASAEGPAKTEVYVQLSNALRDEIKSALSGKTIQLGKTKIDAAEYYDVQSDRIRRLIQTRDILEGVPRMERRNPDVLGRVLGLGAAGTILSGQYLGSEILGTPGVAPYVIGTAGIIGAKSAYEKISKEAPGSVATWANKLGKGLNVLEQTPPEVVVPFSREAIESGQLPPEENPRNMGPQASIPRRLQNLPMELIKTPLPRTTEGLLKNKNFVLAKIAQEAPSMFGAIKDVMENQPDKLPALASMAAQQVPQLFEQDKYNSFDGVIMDPKMKIMAMDDVRGNDSLSSIEKAKMFKKIQKNQRIS